MLDIRLLKTYCNLSNTEPNEDTQFIADTIYTRIRRPGGGYGHASMPTVDQLLNFSSLLTVNKWDSRLSIANAAADLAISGNMTFMQTQALATILGCHKRASAFGRAPEVEYNMIKLEQQIKLFFATEWETVLKGKKKPQSSIEFTVAGDASSLQTHLENFVRKNETERVSKRLKLNDLSTELSQQIDGRAACSWAVELNVPHCLKILLDFAAKDGPATFKEVTEIQNDKYRIRGYCPCAHAILNNNLECILEFIRAGFDFFGNNIIAGIRQRTSALAYLVTETSRNPPRYIKNFKIILSELQKNPNFDPNMEIACSEFFESIDTDDDDDYAYTPTYQHPGRDLHRNRALARRLLMDRNFISSLTSLSRSSDPEDIPDIDHGGAGPSSYVPVSPVYNDEPTYVDSIDYQAVAAENERAPGSLQRLFEQIDAIEYSEVSSESDQEDEEESEDPFTINTTKNILALAASQGGIDVMRILLDIGATPTVEALFDAARHIVRNDYISEGADKACLEALLEAGVDLNAVDPVEETTVLHIVVAGTSLGSCGILEMLLDRGADPTKRNGEGKTPIDLAEDFANSEFVEILKRFARLKRLSSQDERINVGTDDIPENMLCVACLQAKKEVILAPCGHKLLCQRCMKRLLNRPEPERRCPTCRSTVESFVTTIYE